MITTEECGCTHDGTSWLTKCDKCQKADDEVAARWAADRNRTIEVKCHRMNGKVVSGEAPPVVEPEQPLLVRKTPIVVAAAKAAGVAVTDIKMSTAVEAKDMTGHIAAPKAGTKLEQALEIYKGLKDRSRKNVIAIFVQTLNMTPAGASTYQHTCKQRLGV